MRRPTPHVGRRTHHRRGQECLNMHASGIPSWYSDLITYLVHLPIPVEVVETPTPTYVALPHSNNPWKPRTSLFSYNEKRGTGMVNRYTEQWPFETTSLSHTLSIALPSRDYSSPTPQNAVEQHTTQRPPLPPLPPPSDTSSPPSRGHFHASRTSTTTRAHTPTPPPYPPILADRPTLPCPPSLPCLEGV
ncbi:hypothetical protein M422DRAFT_786321 [Sphaerobolus stellatus SS14]|uniref:Uncharacterized protein n=1 Tax=Sphaerobolus stellatus (strain SS14) TaxID=990650 RepID=A0A0C9TM49_SPHS4|nr:hypothetical protein M422DRAFT_786321 [Sphaerobolus stellatus SS14]